MLELDCDVRGQSVLFHGIKPLQAPDDANAANDCRNGAACPVPNRRIREHGWGEIAFADLVSVVWDIKDTLGGGTGEQLTGVGGFLALVLELLFGDDEGV